jgi:hypothetical protein
MADCMRHAHSSPCPHCAEEVRAFGTETEEQKEARRVRICWVFIVVAALYIVVGSICGFVQPVLP